MSADGFEATFRLQVDRATAWDRLTAADREPGQLWLPGFDGTATVVEADEQVRLRAVKDDQPCAGTDIVVTLADDGTGTRIHVVQSGFGDALPFPRELMAVGWRFIVADLQTFLATGVHARRHLRPWGDLGATAVEADGGLRIGRVRAGSPADRLGLTDGDLLTALAGAPVASQDDLVTILRAGGSEGPASAEWIRAGELVKAS